MKVIKNINNNVSLCIDSKGRELIAFGKGIGFQKPPYELPLSKIERTFYNVLPDQLALFEQIPEEIFDVTMFIVDMATEKLKAQLNPNITFVLADHINFAIQRHKQGLKVRMPNATMLEADYPIEFEIGKQGVALIRKKLKIGLSADEQISIALHLINAESIPAELNQTTLNREKITEDILMIIEEQFQLSIPRSSFNTQRFVTHLNYLLGRIESNQKVESSNEKLFVSVKQEYPQSYQCAMKIEEYLKKNMGYPASNEEILYLMLHINRLTAREQI
ncbi:MAG: PRD domain-containing protein [Erysipelotrichaceae bacterium]|nr:PRD domain-containing protein [Erysipelotrichaceae bacterium]MDY6035730.1 PRD domain-containing protein [Bulleidia sp.]